jgi:hypothetical protein
VYIKNQHTGYEELAEDRYVKLQRGNTLSIVKIRGTGQYLLTIPVTGATIDDAIAFVHEQVPSENPAHCSLLHYLYASSKAYAAEYRTNEACFQSNLPRAPHSVLSNGWTRLFFALLLIGGIQATFLKERSYMAVALTHFCVDVLNSSRNLVMALLAINLGLTNAQLGINLLLYNIGSSFGRILRASGARGRSLSPHDGRRPLAS